MFDRFYFIISPQLTSTIRLYIASNLERNVSSFINMELNKFQIIIIIIV